jgi:hypothetical protein
MMQKNGVERRYSSKVRPKCDHHFWNTHYILTDQEGKINAK